MSRGDRPVNGTCRWCGHPILWTTTAASGAPMPLDVRPNPDGNVLIDRASHGLIATVLGPDQAAQTRNSVRAGELHMPHAATCPTRRRATA